MVSMLRNLKNRRAFQRVASQATDQDIVCGTIVDGEPHYFLMPKDAPEHEVREKAFLLRHGRAMSPLEKSLLRIAEARRAS